MQKNLLISNLLDCYGGLLTEKQRFMLDCYYNEDLSLSEIADNEGITPQGARDIIRRAAKRLENYEKTLKMLEYTERVRNIAKKLAELADNTPQVETAAALKVLADGLIGL